MPGELHTLSIHTRLMGDNVFGFPRLSVDYTGAHVCLHSLRISYLQNKSLLCKVCYYAKEGQGGSGVLLEIDETYAVNST